MNRGELVGRKGESIPASHKVIEHMMSSDLIFVQELKGDQTNEFTPDVQPLEVYLYSEFKEAFEIKNQ